MIRALISRLHEPFPDRQDSNKNLLGTVYISVFVAAFLYVFRPFGLEQMSMGVELAALSFGLISFVFSLTFDWFARYVLRIQTDLPTWTLGKWLFTTLSMVCWIALGNYALLVFVYPNAFQLRVFGGIVSGTLLIGLLPIVVSGLLIQLRAAKRNQTVAQSVFRSPSVEPDQAMASGDDPASSSPSPAPSIEPTIENSLRGGMVLDGIVEFDVSSGASLRLYESQICCVEAMQNYLLVYHLNKVGSQQVIKTIIRSTIAKAQAQLSSSAAMMRCHRSYLVNLNRVETVSGNAQGLKLSINGVADSAIPVSRRYIAEFKHRMKLNQAVV